MIMEEKLPKQLNGLPKEIRAEILLRIPSQKTLDALQLQVRIQNLALGFLTCDSKLATTP